MNDRHINALELLLDEEFKDYPEYSGDPEAGRRQHDAQMKMASRLIQAYQDLNYYRPQWAREFDEITTPTQWEDARGYLVAHLKFLYVVRDRLSASATSTVPD